MYYISPISPSEPTCLRHSAWRGWCRELAIVGASRRMPPRGSGQLLAAADTEPADASRRACPAPPRGEVALAGRALTSLLVLVLYILVLPE